MVGCRIETIFRFRNEFDTIIRHWLRVETRVPRLGIIFRLATCEIISALSKKIAYLDLDQRAFPIGV